MAACDPQGDSRPNHVRRPISRAELAGRLEEEISRACRHDTPLGLLLVRLDGQREVERVHGQRLASELFAYASHALTSEAIIHRRKENNNLWYDRNTHQGDACRFP